RQSQANPRAAATRIRSPGGSTRTSGRVVGRAGRRAVRSLLGDHRRAARRAQPSARMIVLDASVALKLVFPEQHSDRALALLTATVQAGDTILAPPLLPFEVANAIRQRMIRQGLALPRADHIMTRFLALPFTLAAPAGLY